MVLGALGQGLTFIKLTFFWLVFPLKKTKKPESKKTFLTREIEELSKRETLSSLVFALLLLLLGGGATYRIIWIEIVSSCCQVHNREIWYINSFQNLQNKGPLQQELEHSYNTHIQRTTCWMYFSHHFLLKLPQKKQRSSTKPKTNHSQKPNRTKIIFERWEPNHLPPKQNPLKQPPSQKQDNTSFF